MEEGVEGSVWHALFFSDSSWLGLIMAAQTPGSLGHAALIDRYSSAS